MPRRTSSDLEQLLYVASVQDGLVTAAQLAELSFPESSVRWRSRSGGPWRRILPGIYLVHGGPISPRARDRAALLYAGRDALLTGWTALERQGVAAARGRWPQQRHVLVPDARKRTSAGFVVVERTERLPKPLPVDGLPFAPLARAVVDGSRRTPDRRLTRALVTEVVQRGRVTASALLEEVESGQRRGTALVREAAREALAGVMSAPEAELRELLLTATPTEPLWNPTLLTPSGQFLASPDGYVEDIGLALEVDSIAHHATPDGFARTTMRHTRMGTFGVFVAHWLPTRIRRHPRQVVQEFLAILDQLSGRGPADVIVVPRRANAA